jgi:hypothetical protein
MNLRTLAFSLALSSLAGSICASSSQAPPYTIAQGVGDEPVLLPQEERYKILSPEEVRKRPSMPARFANHLLGMLVGVNNDLANPPEYLLLFQHSFGGVTNANQLDEFATLTFSLLSKPIDQDLTSLVNKRLEDVSTKIGAGVGSVNSVHLELASMKIKARPYKSAVVQVLVGTVVYKAVLAGEFDFIARPVLLGLISPSPGRLFYFASYGEIGMLDPSAAQLNDFITYSERFAELNRK